jgi:biopolymer transport protein ExbB/TolQ
MVGGITLFAWLLMASVTAWLVLPVWKRRQNTRLATKLVAALTAASALFGVLGTLAGATRVIGALCTQGRDVSQKARQVGEGISEAMNATALAVVIWVPSLIVLLVLVRGNKDRSR